MAALHDLSALEQAAAVRRREVSPSDLVEHYLSRIERWSDAVGAYVTVTPELAREQARAADDGLPIGVMLAGRPAGEAALLSLAGQLEVARPWIDRHPECW